MSKYYCLIAGLPDIFLDDRKLSYTVADFRKDLANELSIQDKTLVDLHFLQKDNQNLLQYLKDKDVEFDEWSIISKDTFAEIIRRIKDEEGLKDISIPYYILEYIQARLSENPLSENLSWEDQLNGIYQDYLLNCRNKFFAAWFELNLNISNIRVALSARKFDYDVASLVVGNNDIAQQLRTSNSKDFGLPGRFPRFETLQRILDETDLLEKEKKIDLFKWNWLDEHTFFFYFSIENIFAYLLKLEMVERWLLLHKDTGEKMFRKMVESLRAEISVPEEFR